MGYVTPQYPDCENCNKTGLAILPVRYAVVPMVAKAELPASLGNKVTNVALKHHKYALRTLRKGYLYLYYERHGRGKHIKWEVYSVSESGIVIKQESIDSIRESTGMVCSRKEHLIPASFITIVSPEKCGRVWMAFSEHMWSEKTFNDFERDIKLRDQRMQTFNPSLWIKKSDYRHGLEATETNLNEIIEYKKGFVLSVLGGTGVRTISQPDGSFAKDVLNHCSTVHPLSVRRDDKSKLVEVMKKAGETKNGSIHPPIIIALWDSVGITHELNGFRNDAAGWIKKYSIEREWEIGAAVAIQGARKALEGRAEKKIRAITNRGTFQWDAARTQVTMQESDSRNTINRAQRDRLRDLCARWERDAAAGAPAPIADRRGLVTSLPENQWQLNMAKIDAEIAAASASSNHFGKSRVQSRDEFSDSLSKEAVAEAWPKYEALIDRAELDEFKKKYQSFLNSVTPLVDGRTEDVVAWLLSANLQAALTEFHLSDLYDGSVFEAMVGNVTMGIGSSPAGYNYIVEAIAESKCSDRNLIWRAIAMNQQEMFEEVNLAFAKIDSVREQPLNETTLKEVAGDCLKYFAKISQMVSKALALHNSLRKEGVKPIPTMGLEKILLTVGGLFMRPYIKKGADKIASFLVNGLILVRSGAECDHVMELLAAEAKYAKMDKANTLLLLRVGKEAANKSGIAARKILEEKFAKLVGNAEVPKTEKNPKLSGGFNEARELRFGIVATLIQMAYVGKLIHDVEETPDNKSLCAELWAAGMSLGAGLADIGALCVKVVHVSADQAMSYQGLKIAGGLFGAASG
jgi:hypothetical protein